MARSEFEKKVLAEARYMIENKATVRETANAMGMSKSTVHQHLRKDLREVDPILHAWVCEILEQNKDERAVRGGEATRLKYEAIKDHK